MVELDGFSHDSGIAAVVPLPELIAQDRYGLRILPIGGIGGHEVSAEQGRSARGTGNGIPIISSTTTSSGTSPPVTVWLV